MDSRFLAILLNDDSRDVAAKVSDSLGFVEPQIVIGTPASAVSFLEQSGVSPLYILIDIGAYGLEALNELDALASFCDANTKVVILGDINDLNLYRQFIAKGVSEYFVKPGNPQEIREAFLKSGGEKAKSEYSDARGKVFSFMSAASGDGASTIALNAAYAIASEFNASTVIVDMDYQFGLIARNLDLTPISGLADLLAHPEGAIDQTFLEKTIVEYKDNLSVISAPRMLEFMPKITSHTIANLIFILRTKFKYVILDLPHGWSEWITILLKEVDHNLIVSQLSIKSVTHTSRLLDAFQISGVNSNNSSLLINRSGSKLKEPITAQDFVMACKKKVDYYVSNESKTMAMAEDQGVTAIELGNTILNKQFREVAASLYKVSNASYSGDA